MIHFNEYELKIGFNLFCLKRELERNYSYIDHEKIVDYITQIENIKRDCQFLRFDMDYLINVLKEKYNIDKIFQYSSQQKYWIAFSENHMFIRVGWMSSSAECGHMYENNSKCNWKSSSEECGGVEWHAQCYQSLINFVFES
jgi:hypothetical protein